MTKIDKTLYDNLDYLPFGEQLTGDTGTTHKFTGKERDSESGLDNMGARFYASSAGRFLSPDYVLGDANLGDPQTFNLYMYSRNNPLIFVDPSGNEIKYAPNLRNAEAVRDTVNAILADPATSGTLSGYAGPNNPDLTIQSGDLSASDTRKVNADGSITTTQTLGQTEPDIQTTTWSTGPETQLNSTTITIDNRVTENGVPGVMSHEAEHAGEARSDPAKFQADARAESALPHDSRPQEQRANAFQQQHEKDLAKAAKQAKADREKRQKEEEKRKKEEKKASKKKKKKESDQ